MGLYLDDPVYKYTNERIRMLFSTSESVSSYHYSEQTTWLYY